MSLHYPVYLNYIPGIAKIIGVVVLIQWRFRTIKEWAYAGFTIDILGAAGSSYFVEGIGPAIFTAVFLVLPLSCYYLWKKNAAPGALEKNSSNNRTAGSAGGSRGPKTINRYKVRMEPALPFCL